MSDEVKRDRGGLRGGGDECKGCGLCINACPPKAISLSERLNHYGYRTATYAGKGCTGCGICFMVCPEPGALTVDKLAKNLAAAGWMGRGALGGSGCTSN